MTPSNRRCPSGEEEEERGRTGEGYRDTEDLHSEHTILDGMWGIIYDGLGAMTRGGNKWRQTDVHEMMEVATWVV